MAGDLLQLRAKVECCTFSDFRSTQTMYHLIHQIVEVVQQQYVPGSDPTAFYDILWRFHTAEQHLNIFKPVALDTYAGAYYKKAFSNARNDTLYLLSLLQSAVRFGQVLPVISNQDV
jgi:hypothetical protein